MPPITGSFTTLELDAIENGGARIYRGRVIPIPRGGDGTDDAGTGDQGAGDGAGDAGSGTGGDAPRTFTQTELDKIVQDRVARAKSAPPSDYEELKAAKVKLDELEAASKTEQEKAAERATKAEADAKAAIANANTRLIQAEVLAAATAAKAIKPAHLHKLIDLNGVTVGDDGQVTGAEEAVKAFLDANPEYVGARGSGGSADQGARSGGANQLHSTDGMSPAEIAKALSEGRLDEYLKSSK